MDIHYAILGYLSWQPLSGYDLKKMIAESDLFYWSGNNNQIYNSLVQLHQQGLVTVEVLPQENLPARKVYTITPAGREQLRGWALAHPELPEERANFHIQLAWAEALSNSELDALLATYAEEVEAQLRMAQARAAEPAPARSPREDLIWRRIAAQRVAGWQAELEWARQLRRDLTAA